MHNYRIALAWCLTAALQCFSMSAAHAQLNENCVVSVLNRNVQAAADGTWVLPNIPANFGQVRARATCVQDGVTTYGESALFTIPANGSVTLPPIILGPTTPIPTQLRLVAPAPTMTTAGSTMQLQALATYPGTGGEVDVTTTGTSYSISNTGIATITPTGLVTAVRSGTVVAQALKEGTQGIVMLRVLLDGADTDGDGIPDAEEVRLGMDPTNAADAALDQDHDGLTALQEYQAGTDPRNRDTDGDTLSDGEEVGCTRGGFCTNPLLADTDGDGIRDATEIATSSDPTNATSFNLGAAVASLRATPSSFTLIVNSLTGSASVQLTIIGTMIDGFEINLTSTSRQTTYSSNNLDSCNFGSPDGRVFASAAGECVITVRNNGRTVNVNGTVRNFAPSAVSFVDIPGYPNSVAVNGDFAYVAAGSTGLKVVNLSSNRVTPTVVATLDLGANANDITIDGTTAYIATSAGLKVVDITNPTTPQLLGSFAGTGNSMGVKVWGTTAFVVGGGTLYIVSVANPNAMIQAGSLALGGTTWNVDLDPTRNLAAVAAGSAGLKLVDISNLSAPALRGTLATGDARGIALRGNTAIVGDLSTSMNSVDITNIASPQLLSRTTTTLGGALNYVALSGSFALGADVNFVNGVPIVDISNPSSLQPRLILNFPARDDNGMGVAVDSGYVYLTAVQSFIDRGGSNGTGRLYIGQFQPMEDLAGVPPTATITSPLNGNQFFEGQQLTISVDAADDFAVAAVDFKLNGTVAFTTTTAPYRYTFTVPSGISTLSLQAVARDLGGNEGASQIVTVNVAPDPLTRVIGRVMATVDTPAPGASVTAPGGRTGTTGADGRFQLDNVPTILGNITVQAQYTDGQGNTRSGSSVPLPPVLGGTTDVGVVLLGDLRFETQFGARWTNVDDDSTSRTLPFAFPFYGQSYTTAFVGTNGYITFDGGDNRYTESVDVFSSMKRISAFFDDLYGGQSGAPGAVYINDTLPDRFIVTHDRVPHYNRPGTSNTLQLQLFRDGRIVFAFNGMSSLSDGAITGLTPGPGSPFVQVDYSATPTIDVPPGTSVYEYFNSVSLFDLDNFFIEYTPVGGGYRVRTVAAPPVAQLSALSGGLAANLAVPDTRPATRARNAARARGLTRKDLAHAEVIVRSSTNPRYVGMTNTDAQGRFTLQGVPAGGVEVLVRRHGVSIARGAGIFAGGKLNQAQLLEIELVSAEQQPKASKQK